MSNLFKRTVLYEISCRFFNRKGYKWYGEGIRYPGFTYYPRTPEFKDPPYEATKLFRVQRIRPLKGVPYYEKDILHLFKLDECASKAVIVKNIPENNAKLWKIKHLINIKPITFPNGFPEDANGTFLQENGEMVVKRAYKPVEQRLIATTQFLEDPQRLDGNTLRSRLRKKWLSGW